MLQSFPLMLQKKKSYPARFDFFSQLFYNQNVVTFFVKMYKSRIQKRE